MKTEVWRHVIGYEGRYMVSNLGRVQSIGREVDYPNGVKINLSKRILKLTTHKYGYKIASMNMNGHNKKVGVHILVAKAFIPNPDNKPQVNHIDGDKANNNVSNLEWVTSAENASHNILPKMKHKHIGVRYEPRGGSWVAGISKGNKRIHIGTFKTEEEAHKARTEYLKTHLIPNKYAN